jgi:hypothetical protein
MGKNYKRYRYKSYWIVLLVLFFCTVAFIVLIPRHNTPTLKISDANNVSDETPLAEKVPSESAVSIQTTDNKIDSQPVPPNIKTDKVVSAETISNNTKDSTETFSMDGYGIIKSVTVKRISDLDFIKKWNLEMVAYHFAYNSQSGELLDRYAYRIGEAEWETCDKDPQQYRIRKYKDTTGADVLEFTPIEGKPLMQYP